MWALNEHTFDINVSFLLIKQGSKLSYPYNLYMFRVGLLLIIRRYYSVYTAVGIYMCVCVWCISEWRSLLILSTASQHICMIYTNCCIYTVVSSDDEQHTCSKHVEFNYWNRTVHPVGSYCVVISQCAVNKTLNLSVPNKQSIYTVIRTSKRNCIRPLQQFGTTKHAYINS